MLTCSSKGLERVLPAHMEPNQKGTSAGEGLSPAMTIVTGKKLFLCHTFVWARVYFSSFVMDFIVMNVRWLMSGG